MVLDKWNYNILSDVMTNKMTKAIHHVITRGLSYSFANVNYKKKYLWGFDGNVVNMLKTSLVSLNISYIYIILVLLKRADGLIYRRPS